MSWDETKLGEVCLLRTGKLDSNAAVENGKYPFFTCDPNTLAINDYAFDEEAALLAGNNASADYTAKYYSGKFNAYQRTYVITPRDPSVYNVRFLVYALNCSLRYLKSVSVGTSTKYLTKTILDNLVLPFPNIQQQLKIVDYLSAYDELIENNRRQIKLLEEAAQRLYKEWFVDLKFPGHESTPIVNGLPEGWKSTHLSNLVTFLNGYAFKSNQFVEDGKFKIATIKNVQDGYFEPNPASSIREIPTNMPAHCVLAKGDILLSLTGNIGRICMVTNDNFLLNQRVAKLVSRYRCYTYCLFKDSVFSAELKNLANGAAQKNLSPNKAGLLNITKPSDKLLSAFESLSLPYFSQINYLYFQITVAREARDRLLPKLMSGEIEV